MLASLAWEEASQSQSRHRRSWSHHRHHRRCRHRPRPPPPGPPSPSSTEDYNPTTFSCRRRRYPRRSGRKAIRPRWTTGCLET